MWLPWWGWAIVVGVILCVVAVVLVLWFYVFSDTNQSPVDEPPVAPVTNTETTVPEVEVPTSDITRYRTGTRATWSRVSAPATLNNTATFSVEEAFLTPILNILEVSDFSGHLYTISSILPLNNTEVTCVLETQHKNNLVMEQSVPTTDDIMLVEVYNSNDWETAFLVYSNSANQLYHYSFQTQTTTLIATVSNPIVGFYLYKHVSTDSWYLWIAETNQMARRIASTIEGLVVANSTTLSTPPNVSSPFAYMWCCRTGTTENNIHFVFGTDNKVYVMTSRSIDLGWMGIGGSNWGCLSYHWSATRDEDMIGASYKGFHVFMRSSDSKIQINMFRSDDNFSTYYHEVTALSGTDILNCCYAQTNIPVIVFSMGTNLIYNKTGSFVLKTGVTELAQESLMYYESKDALVHIYAHTGGGTVVHTTWDPAEPSNDTVLLETYTYNRQVDEWCVISGNQNILLYRSDTSLYMDFPYPQVKALVLGNVERL